MIFTWKQQKVKKHDGSIPSWLHYLSYIFSTKTSIGINWYNIIWTKRILNCFGDEYSRQVEDIFYAKDKLIIRDRALSKWILDSKFSQKNICIILRKKTFRENLSFSNNLLAPFKKFHNTLKFDYYLVLQAKVVSIFMKRNNAYSGKRYSEKWLRLWNRMQIDWDGNDDQLIAVPWSDESCLSKLDPPTCEIVWRTTRRTDARVI